MPLFRRDSADRLLRSLSLLCALASAMILLLILVFLTQASWPLLQEPGNLLGNSWQPSKGLFGCRPCWPGPPARRCPTSTSAR